MCRLKLKIHWYEMCQVKEMFSYFGWTWTRENIEGWDHYAIQIHSGLIYISRVSFWTNLHYMYHCTCPLCYYLRNWMILILLPPSDIWLLTSRDKYHFIKTPQNKLDKTNPNNRCYEKFFLEVSFSVMHIHKADTLTSQLGLLVI